MGSTIQFREEIPDLAAAGLGNVPEMVEDLIGRLPDVEAFRGDMRDAFGLLRRLAEASIEMQDFERVLEDPERSPGLARKMVRDRQPFDYTTAMAILSWGLWFDRMDETFARVDAVCWEAFYRLRECLEQTEETSEEAVPA